MGKIDNRMIYFLILYHKICSTANINSLFTMKTSITGCITVFVAFVFLSIGNIFSQGMNELVYSEDTTFSASELHELRLRFRNLNFFRNNEYKGELVKGYTLPGLWILPSVSYQPLRSLKIEAGAYMLRYWGESKYPNTHYANLPGYDTGDTQSAFHAVPFFRVHYKPLPGISLVPIPRRVSNFYGIPDALIWICG